MNFEQGEVLLIDKPLRWTSFDVVNKLRYALTRKIGKRIKVGHAGTLDPLATGLLLICTGKMTKRIDEFTGMDKEYAGTFHIGATTPSYDSETEPDNHFSTAHITAELIYNTAQKFSGAMEQMPPLFSAIKVAGTAAYIKARKGKEVELKKRPVVIHQFEITRIAVPEVDFRVKCSKGTYIRSLAFDFGKALNSGAYLSKLCRTKIGDYKIEDALSLEQAIERIETANT
ncbi:MAG: tRNA pseudouridine(55) synthase TruB [Chitinophagales bacterium]|nr:tRNA pseudouridine(55) synthase TruB [Chitinophagales bacterium]